MIGLQQSVERDKQILNIYIKGYNARCAGSAAGGSLGSPGNTGNTNLRSIPNLFETVPPFARMQKANEQDRSNAERETEILDQAIQYEQ